MESQSRPEEPDASGEPSQTARPDRLGLLIGGTLLAACGGLVLYGILNSHTGGDGASHHPVPSAAVTYEVTGTGTADLTYQARSTSGKAVVVKAAALPWHKTVDVPLGKEPIVSIVLGAQGGQARCTLAIRGHHVQSATATGAFGRATCSGPAPAAQATQN
ncbi:hypothetical protein [Streptomyces sp. NPDC001153]